MSKVWEVMAVYEVIADTEEEVWEKWGLGEVRYDCIEDITEIGETEEEDDDE